MTRDTECAVLQAVKLLLERSRDGDADNAKGWEVAEKLDYAIAQLDRECPLCRVMDGGHERECPNLR